MTFLRSVRVLPGVCAVIIAALLVGGAGAALGVCGPFSDVSDAAFCPFVLEVFTLGITTGTTPTTYEPASNVTRLQMAAFLSRTVDRTLLRGSRRAALNQFYTPKNELVLSLTTIGTAGSIPQFVASDGADLWVSNAGASGGVYRVRGSDARVLETWTGFTGSVLVAFGRVFVTDGSTPGRLGRINPSQAAGAITTIATNLGGNPFSITFDGTRIWTANNLGGSVSIVTPAAALPWPVTTVSSGFSAPLGALYDGANVWVTDYTAGTLLKLDVAASILQTVTVGSQPFLPLFDGTNMWVPNSGSSSISVVRPSTGAVISTLTGNGLSSPYSAAFDGQRVLVTNNSNASVSLWKAADLTPLGNFPTGVGTSPVSACSDGINFWITLQGTPALARF